MSLSQAMQQGLALDGGLFVPACFPKIDYSSLPESISYSQFAENMLAPFFKEDSLSRHLSSICQRSFNFPLSRVELDANNEILELFHGPTLSFKDFGAQFLANCLSHVKTDKTFTILVATSGDTGSAVASAFYQKPNIRVVVLFPKDKISMRQQHQITCWGDNVLALAVKGRFDDCQKLVKAAFSDPWWQSKTHLNTSNSINIGRLLPQTTYYAYTAWQYFLKHKQKANFIVPSGNIGNVTACFWAKEMGFPIGRIVVSQNENNVIGQYLQSKKLPNKPSIETLANAMDVGKPSNFERLYDLFDHDFEEFKQHVHGLKASDQAIKQTVLSVYQQYGQIICPHTATAFYARSLLDSNTPFIMVATAHPAKFENIVEPILQQKIQVPEHLKALLDKKQHYTQIAPEMDQLCKAYQEAFLPKSYI